MPSASRQPLIQVLGAVGGLTDSAGQAWESPSGFATALWGHLSASAAAAIPQVVEMQPGGDDAACC